jgi:hypothetical protein
VSFRGRIRLVCHPFAYALFSDESGSYALHRMMLQTIQPFFEFQGFVLLDPAILQPGTHSGVTLTKMFKGWAKSKRGAWSSREEAASYLRNHVAFRNWHQEAFDSFVVRAHLPFITALSCLTESQQNALRFTYDTETMVTLACSQDREAVSAITSCCCEYLTWRAGILCTI